MITATKRKKIMEMLQGHCAYCGKIMSKNSMSANKGTIDHVVPLAVGGSSKLKNLLPACSSCNAEKGRLSIEEYRVIWQSRISAFLVRMGFKFDNLPPVRFYFESKLNVGSTVELIRDDRVVKNYGGVIKLYDLWAEDFTNEILEEKAILEKTEIPTDEIVHAGLNPGNFSRPPKGISNILSSDCALNRSMIKVSNRIQNLECAHERMRKILFHCLGQMDEVAHRCAEVDKRVQR